MYRINSKYRKLELSLNDEVPTLSEMRSCLGLSLAQVFFEYSHDETKKILGLTPPLKHLEKCLSASDELNADVLTNAEVIKADIHQNILEIGKELLEKFQREIEEKVQESIEGRLEEKFLMYEAKKRREIELNTQELHMKYEHYIETVQHELEEKLEIEWANAVVKCNKNIQKSVVQERINVTDEMLQKMRTQIRYVIKSLYDEFEESFRAQRENMIADFNEIMRREHVKLNKNMKEFEERKAKDLHVQRHDLEVQNTADIFYVLCLERLRSRTEKHAIHSYFEKQLRAFQDLIIRLNETMNVMKEEIIQSHVKRKLLEEQFYDITKEFQKFVNFVFHAVPGQADFLLPLELQRLIISNTDKEEERK